MNLLLALLMFAGSTHAADRKDLRDRINVTLVRGTPIKDAEITVGGVVDLFSFRIGQKHKRETKKTNAAGQANLEFRSLEAFQFQHLCAKLDGIHYCADVSQARAAGDVIETSKHLFLTKNRLNEALNHSISEFDPRVKSTCRFELTSFENRLVPYFGNERSWAWSIHCSPTHPTLGSADLSSAPSESPPPMRPVNSIFTNFASCSAVLDGIPTVLDFFEEHDSQSDRTTGRGYFVQTIGSGDDSIKFMGHATITKHGTSRRIQTYVILDPTSPFTAFELPENGADEVELRTRSGIFWGKFTCRNPLSIPD